MRHEPTSGYEDAALNYCVTWKNYDDGDVVHEEIFTSRDQGWDTVEMKRRSPDCHSVTWDFIPV